MHIDCLVRQGTKDMCQDYCLPFENGVIISDGCSSSPMTDIGARILCLSAKKVIQKGILDYNTLGDETINFSKQIVDNLGLPYRCLDATLIILYVSDNYINIYVYGDGYILYEDINGNNSATKIFYEDNAPDYLSYDLDISRYKEYLSKFKGKRSILYSEAKNGEVFVSWEREVPYYHCGYSLETCRSISVFSDGISSYTYKIEDGVKEYHDILFLNQYSHIKPGIGKYVNRRWNGLNRYLSKYLNATHYDDISIAGISFVG